MVRYVVVEFLFEGSVCAVPLSWIGENPQAQVSSLHCLNKWSYDNYNVAILATF